MQEKIDWLRQYYLKNNLPLQTFNLIGIRDEANMSKDVINDKLGFFTDRELFLAEGTTEHWPTPSKGLEKDISVEAYGRYRSCTADLDQARLWHAYRETWKWGCELMKRAARNDNISLPTTIIEELTKRIETGIDA